MDLGWLQMIILGGCGLFSVAVVAAAVVVIVLVVTRKGKRPDGPE